MLEAIKYVSDQIKEEGENQIPDEDLIYEADRDMIDETEYEAKLREWENKINFQP